MRDSTLLNRLLDMPGVSVCGASLPSPGVVVVEVALRRPRLACPHCDYTTRWRYDTRPVASKWRGLIWVCGWCTCGPGCADLYCPSHGAVTEAVPFARHRSGFTRGLEDLTAFLATRTDKSTIARFLRLDCVTVGAHLRAGRGRRVGP